MSTTTATIQFGQGNYQKALADYFAARDWLLETGMVFRSDLCGTLQHPEHADSPLGERMVPQELAEKEGWSTAITVLCEDGESILFVRGLELPEGARLIVDPS